MSEYFTQLNGTTSQMTLIFSFHKYFYWFVWHCFNFHSFLVWLCLEYFSNEDQIFTLVRCLSKYFVTIFRHCNKMISVMIITSPQWVCHWRLGNTHESTASTWQAEYSGIHDDSSRDLGKPEKNNFDTDTT